MNAVQKSRRRGRIGRDVLRARAVEAARLILQAEGLRALNARRVAGAIGVAVGTLYNLFENFDELVLCLNLETLEELATRFAGHPVLPKDPTEGALMLARTYLDFTGAHRHRWAAVLDFSPEHELRAMDELRATISRLIAEVERALAPVFAPGAESDRRLAAAVLWTSLEGISALSAGDSLRMVAPTTAWDMAQSLIVNYVAGLRQKSR